MSGHGICIVASEIFVLLLTHYTVYIQATEQVEEQCESDTDWLWASNTAGIPWKWEYYLQAASRVQTFSISGPICMHIHWPMFLCVTQTDAAKDTTSAICRWGKLRRSWAARLSELVPTTLSTNQQQMYQCGWNLNKWRLCTATGVYLSGKFTTAQWSSGINFKGIQNEIYK